MAPSIFSPASAVEKPTVVTGFSAEDDLDKVWAEVIARCNKITKWDLNEKKTLTIDQVLAKINPPKEKDGSREAKDAAKKVFKNALICVQRFGQFAANAASMVFGPSQQCFNAISFVITAVQDYDAVFGNITVLMERVSVFMEKLRVYLDDQAADVKLDKRLRLTVYKVLDHFLTILGLSHKLTKGWKNKLKLAVEIGAFGKDEGVKDAMAKLETLIADVVSSEISVIVKDLSEAARNIRGVDRKLDQIAEAQERTISTLGHLEAGQEKAGATLVKLEVGQEKTVASLEHLDAGQEKANTSLGHLESAELRRRTEEEDKGRLKDITTALKIDKEYWATRQGELERRRVPNTGQWLLEFGTFSRWTEVEEEKIDADQVPTLKPHVHALSLQANEGYGKSYLCSMVVKHLQEKHREETRVAVAYYYFQKDDQDKKRAGDAAGAEGEADASTSSSANTLNNALKAIIYQLATARTTLGREYAKLIHKACSTKSTSFSKSADLWRMLVSDFSKSLDATFFIVLDGIDDTDGEPGRPLATIIKDILAPEDGSSLKIRLFVTGRPQSLRNLSIEDEDRIPEISIARDDGDSCLNEADIMLYIEDRLQEMAFFQDGKFADLKEHTKEVLGKAVRGDYASLNLKLANISKSRSTRDVKSELEYANESRTDGIERAISALNLTLDEEEIQELNQLLTWEAVCFRNVHINVYEQYLKLLGETQSFDSLATRIQERYSSVLTVDQDGIVTLTAEDIRNYLSEEDEDARIRATEPALQEGEVNLVKKVLQQHFGNIFGGNDTYSKFGFEDFFTSKLKQKPATIHIGSLTECHIRVIQACLNAICDHFDEEDEYDALHAYAWEWFGDHLAKVDVEDVDAPTLQEAGRRLVRMLWDTDFINRWWNTERTDKFRRLWVYSSECHTALFTCMSQPIVHRGLIDLPPERQWVMSVSSEGPNIRVLEKVAEQMARRWFEQTEEVWFLSMDWLLGYLTWLRGEVPEYVDATVEQVEQIEAWSKETLDNAGEEGKWHACVARAMGMIGYWEQAVARYRQAMELLPGDWDLTLQLTNSLGNNKESESAVATWESLIANYEERTTEDDEFKGRFWNTMFYLIGDCHIKLQEFEKTAESYLALLKGEWRLKWSLAQALEKNEELKEAGETLEDLIANNQDRIVNDEEFRTEYYNNMLHSMGSWSTKLEDFEKAEVTYRTLLAEGMERDNFEEFAKRAVYLITTALHKQEKYKETIEMLEELEKRIDLDAGTWLIAMLHEYAGNDDFHERICLAAVRSERLYTLVEKYRMAMRSARTDSSKIGTVLQLQYFLGCLFWTHGTPHSRQMAFEQWEDIMYQQLPEGVNEMENNWVFWARLDSSKRLANGLLTLAKESGLNPMSAEAEKCATRLRRLAGCNPAIVRDRVKNTQISLARLHHLAGDDEKAKDVLRDFVKLAFKQTENEDADTRRDGWYRIAVSLQALDDDENALAVWSTMNPTRPEDESSEDESEEDGEGEAADADAEGEEETAGAEQEDETADVNGAEGEAADADGEDETADANGTEQDDDTEENHPEANGDDNAEDDAPNGEQDPTDEPQPNDADLPNGEAEANDEATADAPTDDKLNGILHQSCDGACGTGWSYAGELDNVHACRDCLDIQFEPACHAKLLAGTLDAAVCDPTHDFLVYPAFDRERWAATTPEEIWVGGVRRARAEWVEEVKRAWKIDEESLRAAERFLWAVRRIQRAWRLSRWMQKGEKMGDTDLLMRCLI